MNIQKVEKAINIFINRWDGNCYGIACEIVKSGLVKGRAVYGHYYGFVAKGEKWNTKRLFQRHGWIVSELGQIIDPTRWSFEGNEPYIAIFESNSEFIKDYDEGGNRLRESMTRPPPAFSSEDKIIHLEVDENIKEFIEGLLANQKTIFIVISRGSPKSPSMNSFIFSSTSR